MLIGNLGKLNDQCKRTSIKTVLLETHMKQVCYAPNRCVLFHLHPICTLYTQKYSRKSNFKRTGYGPTDGRTDRRTDRLTDRPTYRDARTHLINKFANCFATNIYVLPHLHPIHALHMRKYSRKSNFKIPTDGRTDGQTRL